MMKDEVRDCANCGKQHYWGITGHSKDNVPLYGPRPRTDCDDFRPKLEPVPVGVNAQALWQQTGDLDPQATIATRLVVARLRELADGKAGMAAVAAQWPEFLGFVVSQITDLRGTLVRDESKFALLVAHVDEIVEAMKNVTQLAERLALQNKMMRQVLREVHELRDEREAKFSAEITAYEHFGLLPHSDAAQPVVEMDDPQTPPLIGLDDGRNGSPILGEPERHDLWDYRYGDDDDKDEG
jgi:hypothetical protein